MISWERIRELKEEVGEEDFAEIATLFLDETEAALAQLLSAADADEAEALLHSLKGSALNLGFEDMGLMCREGRARAAYGHGWAEEHARIARTYEASKALLLSAGEL